MTDIDTRIQQVFDLMEREWDEGDADGAEARSARAYNSALANVWRILRADTSSVLDNTQELALVSDMAEESHWRERLPEWAERISDQLEFIIREIQKMTDDQAHLDADVQALTTGISDVETEIAALKNQPPAAQLDFTALDAAVARLSADAPAPTPTPDPTPTPAPTPDPTPTS